MEEIVCENCGSIDDYRKEKKHFSNRSGYHLQAICNGCDRYIKNLPQTHKPKTFIPFGKYKGNHTYQIDDLDYLRWFHSICDDERLRIGIEVRMKELNGGIL